MGSSTYASAFWLSLYETKAKDLGKCVMFWFSSECLHLIKGLVNTKYIFENVPLCKVLELKDSALSFM